MGDTYDKCSCYTVLNKAGYFVNHHAAVEAMEQTVRWSSCVLLSSLVSTAVRLLTKNAVA